MNDWFLVPCDKPTCLANVGRPCMTKTGNVLPKMESHVARRRTFYEKFPDRIPQFSPLRSCTSPFRRHMSEAPPPIEPHPLQRIDELEKALAKVRSDIRLQALDRALEHHRRAWSTDPRATADEIKTTTEAFEKIILGEATSVTIVNYPGEPGVKIVNYPADVCPECETKRPAPHKLGCQLCAVSRFEKKS